MASQAHDKCAIYVHAGAGYHSAENEKMHLTTCYDACEAAMALLKAGGSAVDAVEMAVRVLEDREITNAGYGSNLTVDGIVECDAVVVDHLGHSGAVGAMPQMRNPICVARLILDQTGLPLSLRRVAPNTLVGQGATDFAVSQGCKAVPHESLISPAAKDRWLRWRADLKAAEEKAYNPQRDRSVSDIRRRRSRPYQMPQTITQTRIRSQGYRSSTRTTGPSPSGQLPVDASDLATSSPTYSLSNIAAAGNEEQSQASTNPFMNSTQTLLSPENGIRSLYPPSQEDSMDEPANVALEDDLTSVDTTVPGAWKLRTGNPNSKDDSEDDLLPARCLDAEKSSLRHCESEVGTKIISIEQHGNEDKIQDTVGAIAVDALGNIAAAASSGGIGMKSSGRCGPAALVGVGAHVIPVSHDDEDDTCVAVVASGTGEHMTTTLASSVCAQRLYHGIKLGPGTTLMEADNDDDAIRCFVEQEFLDHPSVKQSPCAGAIGCLAVKKQRHGVYLYFVHNTDSFAMASMLADDLKPRTTMSRSARRKGDIGQGGRGCRYKKT